MLAEHFTGKSTVICPGFLYSEFGINEEISRYGSNYPEYCGKVFFSVSHAETWRHGWLAMFGSINYFLFKSCFRYGNRKKHIGRKTVVYAGCSRITTASVLAINCLTMTRQSNGLANSKQYYNANSQ